MVFSKIIICQRIRYICKVILLPSKFKTKNEGLKWLLNIQNNIPNDAWFVTNFQCRNLACNNLNSSLALEGS